MGRHGPTGPQLQLVLVPLRTEVVLRAPDRHRVDGGPFPVGVEGSGAGVEEQEGAWFDAGVRLDVLVRPQQQPLHLVRRDVAGLLDQGPAVRADPNPPPAQPDTTAPAAAAWSG